jgi:hypothetical protein
MTKLTRRKKVAQQNFRSKINHKPVADIVFDHRNEFHAYRIKFGISGVKYFQRQF